MTELVAITETMPGTGNMSQAAMKLVERVIATGIDGVGPLKGAVVVAEEHRRSASDVDDAIRRLIRTHVRLAASSGFVTGLGGVTTMPVALPAGLTGLYVLSTRLSAGIAHLRGYDVSTEEVRSVILLTLLGSAGNEALKQAGVTVGQKALLAGVKKIPGTALTKINQAVGFRLVTKMGQKGVINLHKAVPLVGGPVGAAFDGTTCRSIGAYAKKAFPPKDSAPHVPETAVA